MWTFGPSKMCTQIESGTLIWRTFSCNSPQHPFSPTGFLGLWKAVCLCVFVVMDQNSPQSFPALCYRHALCFVLLEWLMIQHRARKYNSMKGYLPPPVITACWLASMKQLSFLKQSWHDKQKVLPITRSCRGYPINVPEMFACFRINVHSAIKIVGSYLAQLNGTC